MALTSEQVIWNQSLGMIGEEQIDETKTSQKQYVYCNRFYDIARDEVMIDHLWNEAMVNDIILQDDTDPLFGYDNRFLIPTDLLRVVSVDDCLGSDPRNNAAGIFPWEVVGDYIHSDAGEIPQTWADTIKYNANSYVSSTPANYTSGNAYVDGQYVKSGTLVYEVLNDYTATTLAADISAGNLGAGVTGTVGTFLVVSTYTSSSTITADITAGNLTPAGVDRNIIFVRYVKQLTDTTKFTPKLKNAIATKLAIKIVIGLSGDEKKKVDLINEFERLVMPSARSVDGAQGKPRPTSNSSWLRSRQSGTQSWR
jgi:hypothetical protein